MRDRVVFNGKDMTDFGAQCSVKNPNDVPEKDVEYVSVPGRSGDLVRDNGRFNNQTLTVRYFFKDKTQARIDALKAFFASDSAYHRLESTAFPDYYRIASYAGGAESTESQMRINGYVDIDFNCYPQKFLKIGERSISLAASGKIKNPTYFDAYPTLIVTGTGTIQIGDQIITISQNETSIEIDGAELFATTDGLSANDKVSLPEDRITLTPGMNEITLTGPTVKIIPNWWTV